MNTLLKFMGYILRWGSNHFNIACGVTTEATRQTDTLIQRLKPHWHSVEGGSPSNLFHLGT